MDNKKDNKFEKPEMEIILFTGKDIITLSGEEGTVDEGDVPGL